MSCVSRIELLDAGPAFIATSLDGGATLIVMNDDGGQRETPFVLDAGGLPPNSCINDFAVTGNRGVALGCIGVGRLANSCYLVRFAIGATEITPLALPLSISVNSPRLAMNGSGTAFIAGTKAATPSLSWAFLDLDGGLDSHSLANPVNCDGGTTVIDAWYNDSSGITSFELLAFAPSSCAASMQPTDNLELARFAQLDSVTWVGNGGPAADFESAATNRLGHTHNVVYTQGGVPKGATFIAASGVWSLPSQQPGATAMNTISRLTVDGDGGSAVVSGQLAMNASLVDWGSTAVCTSPGCLLVAQLSYTGAPLAADVVDPGGNRALTPASIVFNDRVIDVLATCSSTGSANFLCGHGGRPSWVYFRYR